MKRLLLLAFAAVAAAQEPEVLADEWQLVRIFGHDSGYVHLRAVKRGDIIETTVETNLVMKRMDAEIRIAVTETCEERASDGELRQVLGTSIDRLPKDFRTVFVLRDVEGLSTAETAESLAIPEETVKTRLHRARRLLRGHVEQALGNTVKEVFAFGFARCDRLVAAVLQRIGSTEPTARAVRM